MTDQRVATQVAQGAGSASGAALVPTDQLYGTDLPGIWRRLWQSRRARVSIAILTTIVLACVIGPLALGYSPTSIEPESQFQGPSWSHLLGTDLLGRDTFSRTLDGGRLALLIATLATSFALVVGGTWGGGAALLGGACDAALMRLADAMNAIPMILLALILVAAFGSHIVALAIVLGLLHTPWTARIIRTAVRTEVVSEYCLAARSFGTGRARLLVREVLPNVMSTVLVQASLVMASVMLVEAALSFLGLGTQPPQASWGALLLQGYQEMGSSMWLVIVPGVALFVTVFAVSTLGDALQAALDPRRAGAP